MKVGLGVGVCVGVGANVGVGVSSGSPHSVIVAPISPIVKKIAHTEMKYKAQPLSLVRNFCRRRSFIFVQLT